ncbi:SPOR domain-containing protein [Kaistia terrae]|uniref:SPOR domain-containing protein n=1 Tax=Kaistia terrae TaxID=537017 RepID=A0ABW0PSM8_9HYPH|nr:SPOR domain-containing protein [Kaistia terrae]MCX5577368.1 SPOR domain-containing protein [Kaistia terrae]
MADRYDNSFSRRPAPLDGNTGRRNEQPSPVEDDPLVELARMVSGNSSFDDIVGGRGTVASPVVRPAQQSGVRDTSFDLESELMNDLQTSFDPAVRTASGRPAQVEPPRAAPPRDEGFDHMRMRPGAPAAPSQQWQAAQPPRQAERTQPRYTQETYAQPAAEEEDPYAGTAYAGATDYGRERGQPAQAAAYDQGQYYSGQENGADDHSAGYDDYVDDPNAGYDDNSYDQRHDQSERYAEPRRSRKGLITAAVVLGVVLAGGLGALALKGDGTTSGGAPAIIAADEGPTKVQPVASADSEVAQNKLIYDRASPELAGDEQLVLPDDGPIDETPASNESQASREISRIILPGAPGADGNPSSIDDLAGDFPAAPASSAELDAGPRKVRTVVVKPDGTIISSEAQPRNAGSNANQAAPSTNAPIAAAPEPVATPATPVRTTDAEAPAPVAAEPQVAEVPAVEPATPRAQPAAPAAAARPAASGGFVVQVASQRTEEQALASYKAMQRKFSNVFGGQEPNIVRADLGAKGIYYRARVGPMATRDQAVSFCESLRAAGGDCIVQKN